MTLASDLAHVICTGIIPVPGMVHDPAQPLVLGRQDLNDYVVITWDAINHRCQIQTVYQPPGGAVKQSAYTFDTLGNLLINGASLAVAVPEIAAAVSVAQAAAASAAASAGNAQISETNASSSASDAGSSASTATNQAVLSGQFASAPTGTPLPGGGNSAAVNAQLANEIAQESRDLDVSVPISANETFASGFLFTERQANPAGLITVTVPPDIFTSAEAKSRWARYRLRSATGSVKFVGQAGGTNLVAPQVKARGRATMRWTSVNGTTFRTLVGTAAVPAITAGEFLVVFHAAHQGPASTITMNFTTPGTAGLSFTTLVPLPANARAVSIPDFFVARCPLTAFAAGNINLSFLEGPNVHLQVVDWWAIEGVSGTTPLFAQDARTTTQTTSQATILAVPAQSLLLGTAAQIGPIGSVGFSTMGSSLSVKQSGTTTGIEESTVGNDASGFKNEAFAVGEGVTTAAGDVVLSSTWTSGAYKGGFMGIAYHPKSVVGGGTVVMNYEGGRDTLNVQNAIAELWFQNDGKTVDVMIAKP